MLIEFKIKVDGVSGETPPASTDLTLPAHKHLPAAYVPGTVANALPATPSGLSSGSGAVFVIGPIVICGSGTAPAGAAANAPDKTDQDTNQSNGKGKGKGKGKNPGGSGPQSSTDT